MVGEASVTVRRNDETKGRRKERQGRKETRAAREME